MHTNRRVIRIMLLCEAIAGSTLPSPVLGDETRPNDIAVASSSSARASALATIVERPSFTCDRVLRGATVEIVTVPRLAGDHRHPVGGAAARLYLTRVHAQRLCGDDAGRNDLPPFERAASVFAVPAAVASAPQPSDGELSDHKHIVEIIYNFE